MAFLSKEEIQKRKELFNGREFNIGCGSRGSYVIDRGILYHKTYPNGELNEMNKYDQNNFIYFLPEGINKGLYQEIK